MPSKSNRHIIRLIGWPQCGQRVHEFVFFDVLSLTRGLFYHAVTEKRRTEEGISYVVFPPHFQKDTEAFNSTHPLCY
jgi:hypothetical protein